MDQAQILERIEQTPKRAVVITGGEPFLFPELPSLCQALRQRGHPVHLETSGTLFQQVDASVFCISPKLSTSTPDAVAFPQWHRVHSDSRLNLSVLRQFLENYDDSVWFKFVVASEADLTEVTALLRQLGTQVQRDHVMLMPQGRSIAEITELAPQVVSWCLQGGFRYSDRLHIRLSVM